MALLEEHADVMCELTEMIFGPVPATESEMWGGWLDTSLSNDGKTPVVIPTLVHQSQLDRMHLYHVKRRGLRGGNRQPTYGSSVANESTSITTAELAHRAN